MGAEKGRPELGVLRRNLVLRAPPALQVTNLKGTPWQLRLSLERADSLQPETPGLALLTGCGFSRPEDPGVRQRHVQRHRLLRLQSAHALPTPLGSRAAPPAAALAGKWPQQPSPPCACYLLDQVCEAWARSDFCLEQNGYRTLFLSLSPSTPSGI